MIEYSEKVHRNISDNLKEIRLTAGWTQEELGRYIGYTRQQIRNIEDGKQPMRKTTCIALLAVLSYFRGLKGYERLTLFLDKLL